MAIENVEFAVTARGSRAQKEWRCVLKSGSKVVGNKQTMALAQTAVELTNEGVEQFTFAVLGKEAVDRGYLNTTQDPKRVAAYYKKPLVEQGVIAQAE